MGRGSFMSNQYQYRKHIKYMKNIILFILFVLVIILAVVLFIGRESKESIIPFSIVFLIVHIFVAIFLWKFFKKFTHLKLQLVVIILRTPIIKAIHL